MATVVIDTDPGTDDAIALIMALNSPELEIKGLTTVGGNARLTHTTANALRLLDRLGHPEIPVAAGASRPLRGAYEYGYGFHGSGGLTIALRPVDSGPHPLRAAEFIIDAGSTYGPDLTLIALGPLTNVAHALQRQPVLASQLHKIIVMGGALEGGNVTPYAEFNIYNDPTAANVVFSSGVPTTMIGLDVCRQVAFDRNKTDWSDGETVGEELAADHQFGNENAALGEARTQLLETGGQGIGDLQRRHFGRQFGTDPGQNLGFAEPADRLDNVEIGILRHTTPS